MNEENRVAGRRDRRRGTHARRSVRSGEGAEDGHGVEQLARIGFARAPENVARRALLHHTPRPHNRDPVGHFCDDAHIVGDEKDGRAEVGAKLPHQLEDLSLDGDIQRRGRLVGDQHLWPARQRHRDHNALPHAARQLMRVLAQAPCGLGHVHSLKHGESARPPLLSSRRRRAREWLP